MATPTRSYKDYMQGWPVELQKEMEATLEADTRSVPEETQASVLTKSLTAPPPSPVEGARYLIYTPTPTGVWSGHSGNIAQRTGDAWAFTVPVDGMMVWVDDEDLLYAYATTVWVPNPLAAHALVSGMHTAAGLTPTHVLRATAATTFAFGQAQHADLGGISADQHHNQAHLVDGADHTAAGLTAGHVMRATAATTFAFGQAQHNDLGGITADQHHNQSHVLDGGDHTVAGLTPGHVMRATAPTTAAFGQPQHGDLGGVGANDHHNQSHVLSGGDHTEAGLTAGHVMRATGATTFGWAAPIGVYDTASRPDPTLVLVGTMIFNTDDGVPNWSNGSVWVDASGTPT